MKPILVIDENRDVFLFADVKDAAEFVARELRWQDEFRSEYISYDTSSGEAVTVTHSVNGLAKDYWTEDTQGNNGERSMSGRPLYNVL